MPLLDEDDQEYVKRKLVFLTNSNNSNKNNNKLPIEMNKFRKKAQYYKSNPNLNFNYDEYQQIEYNKSNSNLTSLTPNFNYLSNYEVENSLDDRIGTFNSSQEDQELEIRKEADILLRSKKFPNFIKKHIFKQNSVLKPKAIINNQATAKMHPINRYNSYTSLNKSQFNNQHLQQHKNCNNNYHYNEPLNDNNSSSMNNMNYFMRPKDNEYDDYQKRLNNTSEVWHRSNFFAQKNQIDSII